MTGAPHGRLSVSVPRYFHFGCPVTTPKGEEPPRCYPAAGRIACDACGAWWSRPVAGALPDGISAADPGPRQLRAVGAEEPKPVTLHEEWAAIVALFDDAVTVLQDTDHPAQLASLLVPTAPHVAAVLRSAAALPAESSLAIGATLSFEAEIAIARIITRGAGR